MYHFVSKGQTLKHLSEKLTSAKVLPLLIIQTDELDREQDKLIQNIQSFFKTGSVIVRSSSRSEDTLFESKAGYFKSIFNVSIAEQPSLKRAVNEVVASYGSRNVTDEVLIQPMLSNITMAGVVFTSDIDTLAPYYVINYDTSGKSNRITAGSDCKSMTYIQFKSSSLKTKNKKINKIINACKEIESILNYSFLDIEFAFKGEELYILQVRPIVVKNKENLSAINLSDSLRKIHKKIQKLSQPHPHLLGDKVVFGVMPDWNPAEIIGLKPRRLDLSLYKEFVTDRVWAYQRDNYGYRNLRSHPLLVSFLGVPYIDVRVDFNSFVPKALNDNTARKLVNYYIDKITNEPHHHDKVEFEIVHSCYYLNLRQKLQRLKQSGFSSAEINAIEKSLLSLTNEIIHPQAGLYKEDLKKIDLLKNYYDSIVGSDLPAIDKIYWLIEDTKRYGTLPFAGVARAAFIAVQFLQSFVDLKIITQAEYDCFMNSIDTVAKKMNMDVVRLSKGQMKKSEFLKTYGHLRPGTYDIMSRRYDESFENYFSKVKDNGFIKSGRFTFRKSQIKTIDKILGKNDIAVSAKDLLTFIRESIEGREYAKFIFTKSLSQVLVLIEEFALRFGVSRSDAAYLDIRTLLDLYATLDHRDVKEVLESDIQKNKDFYKYTKAIRLPALIVRPEDVYGFYLEAEKPNFVTLKKITAKTAAEENFKDKALSNRIAFVKSADPGYDFLFTKNIAGLITQFGGANSHMAIRCAERGIPAVIGAGEKNFKIWAQAKVIELDCCNKQVRVVS